MNSKQRDAKRKHGKRKRVLKCQRKNPARKKSVKVAMVKFSGILRNAELEKFAKDLKNSSFGFGVKVSNEDLRNGITGVTLSMKKGTAEYLGWSFLEGDLRPWGERFHKMV